MWGYKYNIFETSQHGFVFLKEAINFNNYK